MFFLSNKTNEIQNQKIELIYKDKYIESSKEFLNLLANGDFVNLDKKAKELNYEKKKIELIKNTKVVYDHKISFGEVRIIKKNDTYLLYLEYLGDKVLFYDATQNNEVSQKAKLNYLIVADIMLLIIIFLVFLRILTPLKNISKAIEKFGEGDYSFRLRENKNNDEISKVVKKFNAMAENIENLITSRSQLLRDISHELRTPIAKAVISLEMLGEGKYNNILKKSINQIDKLTNDLLEIERLNSNNLVLDIKKYSIETILAESLSKMIIEDEEEIVIEIVEIFECYVDINYMSTAVKNLIDNALKYKTKGKVEIIVDKACLEIKNIGNPLSKDIDYYMETFIQEDNSRSTEGYGLGLSIVKRILERHELELKYNYIDNKNIFIIKFLNN